MANLHVDTEVLIYKFLNVFNELHLSAPFEDAWKSQNGLRLSTSHFRIVQKSF